jgi:transposase-like protein
MYASISKKSFRTSDKILKLMQCPWCNSDRVNKNGRKKEKQNYICLDCKKQFIDSYDRRGYAQEIRRECLEMHVNGMGFRAIEKIKGVHHTTVINWVKQSKNQAKLEQHTSENQIENRAENHEDWQNRTPASTPES